MTLLGLLRSSARSAPSISGASMWARIVVPLVRDTRCCIGPLPRIDNTCGLARSKDANRRLPVESLNHRLSRSDRIEARQPDVGEFTNGGVERNCYGVPCVPLRKRMFPAIETGSAGSGQPVAHGSVRHHAFLVDHTASSVWA